MRRMIPLFLTALVCAAALSGCGGGARDQADTEAAIPPTAEAETESEAEAATAGMTFRQAEAEAAEKHTAKSTPDPNALEEYIAEGVGAFYLPAGFEMVCQQTEDPLPMHSATFTKGAVTIYASRFGPDAYEAAGVPMPADLEDFSGRDGVRKDLPEDAQFATDELGNFYVDWIDSDGLTVYYVLKSGQQSYGSVVGYAPAGDEAVGLIPLWLSKAALD